MYDSFEDVNRSRTRVGLLAPCIGVGGADALMLGLVKYAHNLKFTGCAVTNPVLPEQMLWMQSMCGNMLKVHNPVDAKGQVRKAPGVKYHEHVDQAVFHACKDADIILSWCIPNLKDCIFNLDIPVIDYAQNSDEFAKFVVRSNKSVYYKAACSQAAARVFGPEQDVHILYNGIDPGRVTPRMGREDQRKAWGIPEDKKILLFMGRLVKEKHPSAVIQALTKLPEDWIGVIVGKGPQQEALYEEAQKYTPNRVFVVKPRYHVGDILAAADCFILPSDFEGHPLALMEAMLAGLPTVFTDFECMQELKQQFGPMGIMIPKCASADELAAAVLDAVTQDSKHFMYTNNARMTVWHNFTLPTIANQWEAFIDGCLFDWRRRQRQTEIYPILPMRSEKEAEDG